MNFGCSSVGVNLLQYNMMLHKSRLNIASAVLRQIWSVNDLSQLNIIEFLPCRFFTYTGIILPKDEINNSCLVNT